MSYDFKTFIAPTREEILLSMQGAKDFLELFPHAIQPRVVLYLMAQFTLAQRALKEYGDHKQECDLRYGVPEDKRATAVLKCTCGFDEAVPPEIAQGKAGLGGVR